MADVFEGAEWLRDPVFDGVEVTNLLHEADVKGSEPSGPKNVHTLLRREIALPADPASATLFVTGDDYYKLYFNGRFVAQGPEPAYPFMHPYYRLDVTEFLEKGTNCLASHAYYQGLVNRVWNSGDNRSGFMLALEVRFADGSAQRYVTDDRWRFHHLEAFPTGRTFGYETQFAEDIDLRVLPRGWRQVGFDDGAWGVPLRGRQDHAFVEQVTAPIEVRRVDPVQVGKKDERRYFYDFGTVLAGHTRIRVEGSAGDRLEVRHGEELLKPETVRYKMRANCTYQEFPVLAEGENVVEFYDYRTFRYLEILNAPSEPEVWVDVRHHRFDAEASRFTASDELLVRIWDLCKNGVRYGSQGVFVDCPSREKGQYLCDVLITSRSHLTITGDPTLSKKALLDFQASQRICPGIMAVAPGSFMQELTEHSLHWPMLLRDYYRFTGDRVFTGQMVDAAFTEFFAYFERFENEDGLLVGGAGKSILVDWPDNLRDDFDYDYASTRENVVVNSFYYASLCAAVELLDALGRDSTAYDAKAKMLRAAFPGYFLDADTGLFVDAPGSEHSSLHATALPLAFGLTPDSQVADALALIREKRLSCGVYIASFVIEACYRAGDPDLGYDLLTSRDEHSWHEMLKHGATTCMEVWGPDQKWNTSWCHPWSSSPVYLVAEHVMGVAPAEPGWRTIRFEPHMPESMASAAITVPTPQGAVMVEYERDRGFVVTVPPGISVDVHMPAEVRVAVREAASVLTPRQHAVLDAAGWAERVGDGLGLWVSVDDQMLRVVKNGFAVWQARCSTAKNGTGSVQDSEKTPLGWHRIAEKIGRDAPWGQVFESRRPLERRWQPGDASDEDLVLTRILWLTGDEPEKNKGGRLDSHRRCIYIHGTNDEDQIGSPVSHGCVRLRNDDVITLFDRTPSGTPVLISEERSLPQARWLP